MNKTLNKKNVITFILIIFSLFLYSQYPTNDAFQKISVSIFFLLLLPFLYIKITLKRSLSEFGIQKGNLREGIFWGLIALTISGLIFYIIVSQTQFLTQYNLPETAKSNFLFFLFYEILLVGIFLALYEFFFRGFIMLGFSDEMKSKAILVQFLVFVGFLMVVDNFDWNNSLYIILAPFSGIVAYKSRSVLYSWGMSMIAMIIMHTIFIKLVN